MPRSTANGGSSDDPLWWSWRHPPFSECRAKHPLCPQPPILPRGAQCPKSVSGRLGRAQPYRAFICRSRKNCSWWKEGFFSFLVGGGSPDRQSEPGHPPYGQAEMWLTARQTTWLLSDPGGPGFTTAVTRQPGGSHPPPGGRSAVALPAVSGADARVRFGTAASQCGRLAQLDPMWQGSAPFLFRGRMTAIGRCRSSVVEHSLGKGEVVSSILTGSTRK
jgi:hypothetical protein